MTALFVGRNGAGEDLDTYSILRRTDISLTPHCIVISITKFHRRSGIGLGMAFQKLKREGFNHLVGQSWVKVCTAKPVKRGAYPRLFSQTGWGVGKTSPRKVPERDPTASNPIMTSRQAPAAHAKHTRTLCSVFDRVCPWG